MDAFMQMSLHETQLTPTEHQVFDAVIANPELFLQSSATFVAKQIGVSQSAVSRFCQKVGYDSFGSFQMNLMLSLSANTPTAAAGHDDDPVAYLCDMTRATSRAVSQAVLDELADKILSARTVFSTGGGLSEPPALTLSLELLKYNVPCLHVPCGQEMVHIHVAGSEDLLIVFSSKNSTQKMLFGFIQDRPKKLRPHVVMVSHSPIHPLRKYADRFILLPTWQTERYPIYIEPMTSMLAFCSILMIAVSKKTGCNPEPPLAAGL